MDPNATLRDLLAIFAESTILPASGRTAELRYDLNGWLDRGGFAPMVRYEGQDAAFVWAGRRHATIHIVGAILPCDVRYSDIELAS